MLAQLPEKNVKAWKIIRKVFLFWRGPEGKPWIGADAALACQPHLIPLITRLMTRTHRYDTRHSCGCESARGRVYIAVRRHIWARTWSRSRTSWVGVISQSFRTHIHQDHYFPDTLAIIGSHHVPRLGKWYWNYDSRMTYRPHGWYQSEVR